MQQPDSEAIRSETLTAALLYLLAHYARTGCPRLAVCVLRHMQCLASHPDASPQVREVCASLQSTWQVAAEGWLKGALH